jgi:hypothetical protein
MAPIYVINHVYVLFSVIGWLGLGNWIATANYKQQCATIQCTASN